MTNQNYKGLFEDWEIGVATNVVDKYRREWKCLQGDDFEDLLQECLIHWLFAKDKYDPACDASRQTFMARVLKNKVLDIIKDHERDKRKVQQNSVSLFQPICEAEDASTLLEILGDDESFAERLNVNVELQIDLAKAVEKLTPRQRELCALLSETDSNITEISERLGVRRKQVYKEIDRIRAIFEDEGLKNYLS